MIGGVDGKHPPQPVPSEALSALTYSIWEIMYLYLPIRVIPCFNFQRRRYKYVMSKVVWIG